MSCFKPLRNSVVYTVDCSVHNIMYTKEYVFLNVQLVGVAALSKLCVSKQENLSSHGIRTQKPSDY